MMPLCCSCARVNKTRLFRCSSSCRCIPAGWRGGFVSTHPTVLFTAARMAGSSSSSSSVETTAEPRLTRLDMLFRVVSPLIATAPCMTRVAAVYSNLPRTLDEATSSNRPSSQDVARDTHGWLRTHFGTLAAGLQRLQATNATNHWGIFISDDRTHVVKAHSAEEAEETFLALNTERQRLSSWETESLLEVFQPVFPCFTPPPPPPTEPRGSAGKKNKYTSGGMFTPQMLVPYIPTFFIPMEKLLEELPEGYTAEHIERIFAATGTLEVVTLEGEKFVRLHGGKRLVDFTRDGEGKMAHERWREYQPDPFLCEAFRRLMLPPPRWTSLRVLITRAPSELVQALLPWRNYKTLLYFAQMQHVFSFTPEGEGEVCWSAPVMCLSYHDSPTPAVVSELVGVLSGGKRLSIADLQGRECGDCISDYAKVQIMIYYGTLTAFFHAHGDVFLVEDNATVGLLSGKGAVDKAAQTLEDKLENALVRGDRRGARKIRRRIAIEKNPDSPYTDPTVLLDAILRYVPQKRSISLSFLLKSLPPSLSDFLPSKPISMFQQAPEKIRLFEYRYRHRIHLIRPGVSLPPGVLRQHYTEMELLYLCAAELQQQARLTADLYGRLPYGAKEVIRLQYKNLLELLQPYPQYFTVVFKDALRMDTRNALVTLIKMPPSVELSEADYGAIAPEDPEHQRQLEEEDREAMQTLPVEIQKTLRIA